MTLNFARNFFFNDSHSNTPQESESEADVKVNITLKALIYKLYSTPYVVVKASESAPTILYHRVAGGKSRAQQKENQQILTNAEEKTLAQ